MYLFSSLFEVSIGILSLCSGHADRGSGALGLLPVYLNLVIIVIRINNGLQSKSWLGGGMKARSMCSQSARMRTTIHNLCQIKKLGDVTKFSTNYVKDH